jgi:hypothetical protein
MRIESGALRGWLCVYFVLSNKSIFGGERHGERLCRGTPKGRPEVIHIDDYVVEDHANHVLGTFETQHEAIEWAKKNGNTWPVCGI